MTRRVLGRGRLLIGLGALIVIVGAWLPWWTILRTGDRPALTGVAFEGAGVVPFLAAIALLALLVLPVASRAGESALDRPASYVVLSVLSIGAFLLRVFEINADSALGLPDLAPGLWLTGVGLAIVTWGTGELLVERPPEP